MKTLPLACMALVVVGCGAGPEPELSGSTVRPIKPRPINYGTDAGLPVTQSTDEAKLKGLVARTNFGRSRPDPFGLLPAERGYESQQELERLFQGSGFTVLTTRTEDPEPPLPVTEPQPYRRLAGIVVGDSVVAIIDMGNGQTEIVRPGQRIPNTEWTVASLDEDKAVLTRGGNTLPKRIIVRLESPPAGYTAPGGGAPGGFPGAPGGPGGMGGPGGGGPSGMNGGDR